MLKRLYISNYALIEELDVTFPGKLTVITGETGAGKSIFLEALGLALGNRADSGVLQNKTKKCIVEAEFDIKHFSLESFFLRFELDSGPEVVLRREINSEGKSRAFINDTPVNLNTLKELSEQLIDVHSQHQTLLLNNSFFQFELLDVFSGNTGDADNYRKAFQKLMVLKKEHQALLDREKEAKKEQDYLNFLFDELNEVELNANSFKKLEEESASLENAETILSAISKAAGVLGEGDENILFALNLAKQALNPATKYSNESKALADRLAATLVEIKDVYNELSLLNSKLVYNPAELEIINEKIDKINRLFKKHSVNSIIDLENIKLSIQEKLNDFNSLENKITALAKETESLKTVCDEKAAALSKKRKQSVAEIEKHINGTLAELGMPNARFKIEINSVNNLTIHGNDNLVFLFSANKGGEFKELYKVASGGEMSRLMLCLKALVAEKKALPTIIFDEIDTGISGDVANKMGNIFEKMAQKMQVISITHLPQIASKGKHHLFVYKNDEQAITRSFIKNLDKEERVVEIAKMLSTGKPTESAIKNAADLLNQN